MFTSNQPWNKARTAFERLWDHVKKPPGENEHEGQHPPFEAFAGCGLCGQSESVSSACAGCDVICGYSGLIAMT